MEAAILIACVISALSNAFSAFVAYRIAKREKVVDIKLPKRKGKVVVFK